MSSSRWKTIGLGFACGLLTTLISIGALTVVPLLGALLVYPLTLLLVGACGALAAGNMAGTRSALSRGALVGAVAGLVHLVALVASVTVVAWALPYLLLGPPGNPGPAEQDLFNGITKQFAAGGAAVGGCLGLVNMLLTTLAGLVGGVARR